MLRSLLENLMRSARKKASPDATVVDKDSATRRASVDASDDIGTVVALDELVRRAEAFVRAKQLFDALNVYRNAARIYPTSIEAHLDMGNVLVDLWAIDDALAAYSRAQELAPHSMAIFSAVLFHYHYSAAFDRREMFNMHRRFGEMMRTATPQNSQHFVLTPEPDRRLRIGYVSSNFSRHSVGYFIEPVIREHDRGRYEVFCYYTHRLSDETTARIRGLADSWRDIAETDDATVEHLIRDNQIDILVDLAGHSKGHRLGVFARKPAPIQMTWLGYPDTTGLVTMDARITDDVADPAPDAESWYTERLLRIDGTFLCYQPPVDAPPVSANASPPSAVRFSSFNNVAKVNEETIRNWAAILDGVPGSHLVLKSNALNYADTEERMLECFERNGVAPDRIELHGWIRDRQHHLGLYENVDIALDTFPYNGTTTTCEALWMGVPVVTLAGSAHMSRVGATLLRSAGLSSLVTHSAADYVAVAIALANDQSRRRFLRANLRAILSGCSLLDHAGFTRKLEQLYRQCWTDRCQGTRRSSPA